MKRRLQWIAAGAVAVMAFGIQVWAEWLRQREKRRRYVTLSKADRAKAREQ